MNKKYIISIGAAAGGIIIIILAIVLLTLPKQKGEAYTGDYSPIPIDGHLDPTTDDSTAPVDTTPHFNDGTWLVGKDIQPGTYRTRKASASCYWERMADTTGGVNSILANDNTDSYAVVTIGDNDAAFESKRCGTWTQDLSQVTTSKISFGAGTYIVGTDIVPGTYQNTGQTRCYWERLADFSFGTHSVLANDNTDTTTTVTILPTDKGFESARCGVWTMAQ